MIDKEQLGTVMTDTGTLVPEEDIERRLAREFEAYSERLGNLPTGMYDALYLPDSTEEISRNRGERQPMDKSVVLSNVRKFLKAVNNNGCEIVQLLDVRVMHGKREDWGGRYSLNRKMAIVRKGQPRSGQ